MRPSRSHWKHYSECFRFTAVPASIARYGRYVPPAHGREYAVWIALDKPLGQNVIAVGKVPAKCWRQAAMAAAGWLSRTFPRTYALYYISAMRAHRTARRELGWLGEWRTR